jgi:deoxyhypusine synthase
MAGYIRNFAKTHYKHFNAAVVVDASQAYCDLLSSGGKMMITLAGAMSTAELGKSLAEMIRQGKVHAITCTGANLEEDVFNLVANKLYKRVPNYRQLSPEDEKRILEEGYNRVTDTCIPEEQAMMKIDRPLVQLWREAEEKGERKFPHEFFYELLLSGKLKEQYQIPPEDSWLLAAAEKNLPIFVPGWEDSTMGNSFAAEVVMGKNVRNPHLVKGGIEYMMELIKWYKQESRKHKIGFFQIGGGIAGDFPICVVPCLHEDLKEEVSCWAYFCQISDSTTSYGSYSGAVPNEKITWGKLETTTPRFVIESDATIVAPLMFGYVLDW